MDFAIPDGRFAENTRKHHLFMSGPLQNEQFVRLLTEHRQRIYSFIRMLVPDRTDAEEILQEVSIIAWRKMDQFEPGSNFVSWINKISYFEVLAYRKKRSHAAIPFSGRFLEQIEQKVAFLNDRLDDERKTLQQCLRKLNEADRELVERRYLRDEPARVVADSLGRPTTSICRSLQRIRRLLRGCIHRTLASEEGNQKVDLGNTT